MNTVVMAKKSKDPNQRRGISELFIQRPITTTLVMVGIVLFGLIGYRALPVRDLPNVDFPTIQVTATLPGANFEPMVSSFATTVPRQLYTLHGRDQFTHTCIPGKP